MARHLLLALHHMEGLHEAETVGGLDQHDRIGFALGIVRFVRYTLLPDGSVLRNRLAENLHFGPVPYLDDLLRPWTHAAVGWNALCFDNPVAVAAAVWPNPGTYYTSHDLDDEKLRWLGERLGRYGLAPSAAQAFARLSPEAQKEVLDRAELNRLHSRLIPHGAVGMSASRAQVLEALAARTFDPLQAIAELVGHPKPATLEYFVPPLCNPTGPTPGLEPVMLGVETITDAACPRLFREGFMWSVAEKCRRDVHVLEELMHHALMGGTGARILATHLNESLVQPDGTHVRCGDAAAFRQPEGRLWKFRLPTGDWADRILAIDAKSRE